MSKEDFMKVWQRQEDKIPNAQKAIWGRHWPTHSLARANRGPMAFALHLFFVTAHHVCAIFLKFPGTVPYFTQPSLPRELTARGINPPVVTWLMRIYASCQIEFIMISKTQSAGSTGATRRFVWHLGHADDVSLAMVFWTWTPVKMCPLVELIMHTLCWTDAFLKMNRARRHHKSFPPLHQIDNSCLALELEISWWSMYYCLSTLTVLGIFFNFITEVSYNPKWIFPKKLIYSNIVT